MWGGRYVKEKEPGPLFFTKYPLDATCAGFLKIARRYRTSTARCRPLAVFKKSAARDFRYFERFCRLAHDRPAVSLKPVKAILNSRFDFYASNFHKPNLSAPNPPEFTAKFHFT